VLILDEHNSKIGALIPIETTGTKNGKNLQHNTEVELKRIESKKQEF